MFANVAELVNLCTNKNMKIHDLMIMQETEDTGRKKDDIINEMLKNLDIMDLAIKKGIEGVTSHSGLTGRDAKKLMDYIRYGKPLTGGVFLNSICYAIATNEVNAAMGIICATPTAGSAGVVPAALFAVKDKLKMNKNDMVNFLFTSGAFGYIIANNAFIAGATGGCQAEIGSASAMAAASIVEAAGGTPQQCAHACAIALKNMMGLVCDPVAGLVEIPCIKRNAAGAANAITAAEMALAGIESRIPCDEVITAMYRVGKAIPYTLRETALGGLAVTDTGLKYKKKLFG